MIRITAELCPLGDESKPQHLGSMIIANDGGGSAITGNYNAWLSKKGHVRDRWWRTVSNVWRKGRVEGFPRQRLGVWDLMYRVLRETVEDRNPRG